MAASEFPFVDFADLAADGRLLVAVDRAGGCRKLDTASGELLAELELPGAVTGGAVFDPAGDQVAIGCADGTVLRWAAEAGGAEAVHLHAHPVSSVAISAGGALVAAGHADGSVSVQVGAAGDAMVLDANAGLTVGFHRAITAVDLDDAGQYLVTAGRSGVVRLWEVSSGRLVDTLRAAGTGVGAVSFDPSGQAVAIGDMQGGVEIRNWRGGESWKFAAHVDSVLALRFGADGRTLLTGGRDCVVKTWYLPSGRQVNEMRHLGGWIRALALSADGSEIIAADGGGSLAVWDQIGQVISARPTAFGPADDIAGPADRGSPTWRAEAGRFAWSSLNCACGRGAAHVPHDFARLVAATTDAEADGAGLLDDVETQNMLFESIVPLMPMAVLALSDEPLSEPARRTVLELILAGVSGDTHYVEQGLGRDGLEDLCRDAIRPHAVLFHRLLQANPTPREATLLGEIVRELG
ncbi:WD40 repeat domain-containing protein [Actinoplanes siamensis]|uniref:WD40 repeat domain-containing protein n=1 Tax=Actinoplanes siamensis TaxID=1223317 RepID=A0A919NEI9_9ACTN|nr:hypothetical protein [Actinoplanes siamensis]GIF09254.1 hypothetical protein Asi03nite_67920 [Actinoplanes siamensis]